MVVSPFRSLIPICVIMVVLLMPGVFGQNQTVQFADPVLRAHSLAGTKNITESFIRVAIADPGRPINGVYVNLNETNDILNFKVGENVQVSGLETIYFGGNALTAMLVKGNIAAIPPDKEFLTINFEGKQRVLFNTNDLEENKFEFRVPNDIPTGNYTFVIWTGEEELHYYVARAMIS
ncbi:MAG TPA: hypothetical protein VH415_14950 [Nitrososphaeraceae archaeon]